MSNAVTIKNLSFSYDNSQIFSNVSLEIPTGKFISLIDANGSGKSTLVKILAGLLDFKGQIFINELLLNKENINRVRTYLGVIFNNIDNQIISKKVFDNIAFTLSNVGMDRKEIIDNVIQVADLLKINDLLNKNIFDLNNMEKTLVNLASVLIYKPSILILDEALDNLDEIERNKILNILKKINIEKKITIINVTQNIEDILFGDSVIILDNGVIVLNDALDKVFKNDKLFSNLGLDLPFMVNLSIKLQYYGLLDKIVYNMEEMVDALWK